MENYIEYSLPYRLTTTDQCKRIVYTLAPMFVGVFLIMFLGIIGIFLCAILCYISYRIMMSFNFELEYTLLENEISFSKVINKERRKDLFSADIAKTQSYGPIANLPAQHPRLVSVLSNQGKEPEYYWITLNNKGEKVCILFQPNEKVLEVFATRARGKQR